MRIKQLLVFFFGLFLFCVPASAQEDVDPFELDILIEDAILEKAYSIMEEGTYTLEVLSNVGHVTLNGTTRNGTQRYVIETIAAQTKGVHAVYNNIEVVFVE